MSIFHEELVHCPKQRSHLRVADIFPSDTPTHAMSLVLVFVGLVVHDIVEAKFVNTFRCRNYAKPVTELLLLKEFLGPARWLKLSERDSKIIEHKNKK
jgi:hypothetical protein